MNRLRTGLPTTGQEEKSRGMSKAIFTKARGHAYTKKYTLLIPTYPQLTSNINSFHPKRGRCTVFGHKANIVRG